MTSAFLFKDGLFSFEGECRLPVTEVDEEEDGDLLLIVFAVAKLFIVFLGVVAC